MALRQLVTGSDGCAPSEGGGPANAASALADTLLGRRNKAQERLQELPGATLPGGAGPSAATPFQAPTVADAAQAVIDDAAFDFGAAGPPRPQGFDVDEFLRQPGQPPGRAFHRAGFAGPPGPQQWLPPGGSSEAVRPFLQAFVDSSKAGMELQALPRGDMRLPVEEQVRVRDRSTIVARHIYAGRGDAFADAQVDKLLSSLNINAAALPSQLQMRGWDALYDGQPGPAAEMAAAGQMAAQRRPDAAWAQEFSGLSLHDRPPPAQQQWQDEFLQQQRQPLPAQSRGMNWVGEFEGEWAGEFSAQQSGVDGDWSSEFQTQQAAEAGRSTGGQARAGSMLEHTRALQETLSRNQDPKFQQSKFLQFLSKMTRGEVILEDNQVKENKAAVQAGQWAEEFDAQPQGPDQWATQFQAAQPAPQRWSSEFSAEQQSAQRPEWAQEFGREHVAEGVDRWADDFAAGVAEDVEHWAQNFNADGEGWASEFAQAASASAGLAHGRSRQDGYHFAADNPYKDDLDSFAKGKELFRRGVLSEAILALEAEVQRHPQHTDAWRLLGTAHAENEDDIQAIAAMDSALKADPSDLEVLLSLGVSHTNELESTEAMAYMERWLMQHPGHGPVARELPPPPDSTQRHSYLVRQFEAAAAAAPADADLQVALGVLHNLTRQYEPAVDAFRAALVLQPNDYSLWNKLGATLANGSRSGEAVAAYQKALELKPNYMRAWANMGITQANLGNYDASARYYVRALGLNPGAEAVWGYLRTSLSCAGRLDIMPLVDAEDLEGLQRQLSLA